MIPEPRTSRHAGSKASSAFRVAGFMTVQPGKRLSRFGRLVLSRVNVVENLNNSHSDRCDGWPHSLTAVTCLEQKLPSNQAPTPLSAGRAKIKIGAPMGTVTPPRFGMDWYRVSTSRRMADDGQDRVGYFSVGGQPVKGAMVMMRGDPLKPGEGISAPTNEPLGCLGQALKSKSRCSCNGIPTSRRD